MEKRLDISVVVPLYNTSTFAFADDAQSAQMLELAQTAAVEQALTDTVAAVGEEAHGNGTPDAVCKVDGDSAHGVIDLRNVIEELDAQHHEDAGDEADDESTKGRNGVAACGDGHQTSQRAVERHGDVGLAVALPGKEHGHAGGHRSGQVGVEADQTGHGHGSVGGQAQGRAAVEAEPAEPQDEHAQSAGGQVVAGDCAGLAVLVVPYEHRIVVICRLKEQLVIQAITDNNRVNSSALQVFLHAVRCFGQLRHQQLRASSLLLAIENGRLFCLPSENDFCCLRERDALYLDEIVQR